VAGNPVDLPQHRGQVVLPALGVGFQGLGFDCSFIGWTPLR
jgi:hypothetical protein